MDFNINIFIWYFHRPVTVTKQGFVGPEFTNSIDQLSVEAVAQVESTKNFCNSTPKLQSQQYPKYYNEEIFSSPFTRHNRPGSFSTASLYSIDSIVTESAASTKILRCVEMSLE